MRLHIIYLAGALSAATVLATACAERRVQSTSSRDASYSPGWTSGTYVSSSDNRTTYGTSDTGKSGYGTTSGGYSSQGYGTQGGSAGSTTTTTTRTYESGTIGTTNQGYGTTTTGTTTTQGGYGAGTTTGTSTQGGYGTQTRSLETANQWNNVRNGIVVIHPMEGNNCKGTLRFTQSDRGLRVVGDVEGLNANQKIRLRIHEFGDCTSMNGDTLGNTFNGVRVTTTTTTTTTGGMTGMSHDTTVGGTSGTNANELGDLGTFDVDANGRLHFDKVFDNLSVATGDNAILGRSISLRTESDTTSQPSGVSSGSTATTNLPSTMTGNLIACGVIGIGKSDLR